MTTHALNNITINYTMSNSTIKYTVSNAFECYGIPATEKRNTLEAAEQAANNLAEAIAECFYQHDGDQAIIPFYSSEGKTGLSSEIKFQSDLSLDSGAHADEDEEDGVAGRLPWSELVKRIRREAVVISKITWSPVNWQQEPDAEQKDETVSPQFKRALRELPACVGRNCQLPTAEAVGLREQEANHAIES